MELASKYSPKDIEVFYVILHYNQAKRFGYILLTCFR